MNWHYPTSINCGVLSSARWSTGKAFSFWPSYSSSPFPGTAKLLLLSPHPLPTPPQAWLHLLPLPLTPGISLEAPAQSPRQWSAYVSGVHSADNCTPQDLQMLVLRPFRWYKRTKRESYTIYCISVNVGGSIECRSCARENRDEAVPQTPQNRGVHVVHLRKAVLEKKKLAEFFKRWCAVLTPEGIQICPLLGWAVSTLGVPMLVSLTERGPEIMVLESRRQGRRQAEESWGSPFCRQVLCSVFPTFLTHNQNPGWQHPGGT